MVCISGSETCLVTTGMLNYQTNSFLSSELVTNLFCSIKVIVFTVPRCWLYYISFFPVFKSNCIIFLLLDPHKKIFWCSGDGWNFTENGNFFNLNEAFTCPYYVSQYRTIPSNPQLKKCFPSFENCISLTALVWPTYVCANDLFLSTS